MQQENKYAFNTPVLIFYFIVFSAILMTFSHPLYTASLLFVILCGLISDKKISQIKNHLFLALSLSIIIIAVNLIVSSNGHTLIFETSLPLFGKFSFTKETLFFSLNMALKLTSIILLFALLTVSLDRDKSVSFLMRYLPKSSLLFILISAFIPQMKESLVNINNTMKLRGAGRNEKGLLGKIKKNYPLLKILMLSSLENSWSTSEALQARGFGSSKRTSFITEGFKANDFMLMLGTLTAISAFIYALLANKGFYDFFAVDPSQISGFDLVSSFFIVLGLLVLPILKFNRT